MLFFKYSAPMGNDIMGANNMFNVYLDGSYDSTHETFTNACRYARMQASINQQAYFTVFEAGDTNEKQILDAEREVMKGVPAYIITPHAFEPKQEEKRTVGIAALAATSHRATGISRGY